MTVREIYDLIDAFAPFETQADFDNSGLLTGSARQDVHTILFALDLTESVISEASNIGAELIVTHHPLMFSPIRRLTDEDYEARLLRHLIRENISLIAAHTNLDQAHGGMNDVLADLCGLHDISGEGFLRTGFLTEPMTAEAYAVFLSSRLKTTVRLMGPEKATVSKVGLCSGGGGDEWPGAADAGCNAFVSGEIKHHLALAMADRGIVAFECGHFSTEAPGLSALAAALQKKLNTLKCNVRILESASKAYAFPPKP